MKAGLLELAPTLIRVAELIWFWQALYATCPILAAQAGITARCIQVATFSNSGCGCLIISPATQHPALICLYTSGQAALCNQTNADAFCV